MTLHPQIIEKEGKKEFVVLPYEEFIQIQETLEDFEDLKALREAKEEEKNQSSTSLDEVVKSLQI